MKTATPAKRSCVTFVGAATLAVLTLGFTCTVQARDHVSISVGIGVPGIQVRAANGFPIYTQPRPVYVQPAQIYYAAPQPIYYGSQPVYVLQQPVYYSPQPVYVQPQPVYYDRPYGRRHHGGFYAQEFRSGYGGSEYAPDRAPIYYRR